ncbi:hypothetical protein WN48_08294 [Eufriesea mexicana]|uniref:Uncharacterized protein n=1 Tax=Eufriesea mexicana TaxID=516756 RepID=A0A310SJ40_9HYME|nr:hypothetical protein WN48_08294 [Eufriesea mexicana]
MQSHSMSNSISHATNNAIKSELVVIIKIIPGGILHILPTVPSRVNNILPSALSRFSFVPTMMYHAAENVIVICCVPKFEEETQWSLNETLFRV